MDTPALSVPERPPLHPLTVLLLETVAVTLAVVMLLGSFGFLLFGAAYRLLVPMCSGGRVMDARTDAHSIRGAAEMYLAQNPSAACPTVSQLVSERILSARTRTIDPWENAFEITCSGEDVKVVSAGPDETMGTGDDVE